MHVTVNNASHESAEAKEIIQQAKNQRQNKSIEQTSRDGQIIIEQHNLGERKNNMLVSAGNIVMSNLVSQKTKSSQNDTSELQERENEENQNNTGNEPPEEDENSIDDVSNKSEFEENKDENEKRDAKMDVSKSDFATMTTN